MGLKHCYGGYVEPQSGLYGICKLLYPPQQSCRGVYWFHHVRTSVDKSYVVRQLELCFLESFAVPELLELI